MKVVLQLVDIDAQQRHEIVLDGPAIPDAGDSITFEARPGEWITRRVSVRGGFRYEAERVVVELELESLEDDEWAPDSGCP